MRIDAVTAYRVRIPFVAPFAHALHTRANSDAIILRISADDGKIGIGEILPRKYLTGETIETVTRDLLPRVVDLWASITFGSFEQVVAALEQQLKDSEGHLATYAGLETAILDVAGKCFGVYAADILGPAKRSSLAAGIVIDFSVPTAALENYCKLVRVRGIRHLKVKVGLHDDLQRLTTIRAILGSDQQIRLDANCAWSPAEAVQHLNEMHGLNIASIEQPVPADDLAGMRTVREKTGVPVVADESLCTFEDGESLIRDKAADIFNIRIAKCGGVLGSSRLVKLAEESGLRCQLGTLVGETGILSRVAEEFGRRIDDFEFIDGLGQNRNFLKQDIIESKSTQASVQYGYGITLDESALTRLDSTPAMIFARHPLHQETATP